MKTYGRPMTNITDAGGDREPSEKRATGSLLLLLALRHCEVNEYALGGSVEVDRERSRREAEAYGYPGSSLACFCDRDGACRKTPRR